MSRQLSKLLDTMLSTTADPFRHSAWQPSADVYRCDAGWLVKFDLAGVDPNEIEISLNGNQLTIRGSRRDQLVREDHHSYSMEISYNRFERTIELPSVDEGARIASEYRDGMLLVTVMNRQRSGKRP